MASGQSWSKKIGVSPIITHGNIPIGKSQPVTAWNTCWWSGVTAT